MSLGFFFQRARIIVYHTSNTNITNNLVFITYSCLLSKLVKIFTI